MPQSRRDFLKLSTLGSTGLLLPPLVSPATTLNASGNELIDTGEQLLRTWCEGMLALQVQQPLATGVHGGILCPACGAIHGRCSDAIFPFLYMASKTKEKKYIDGALRLYDWAETMVSTPDGAWMNEVNVSDWKGTTVFGATALAEALIHFEHLLDTATRNKWKDRLLKAGNYVYNTFTISIGNINYPIAGSYALCLIGTYLKQPHFVEKGKSLAHQSLAHFTSSNLLYGEGRPNPVKSVKGCYAIDLGYNVEESLSSLVLYGKLMNDTEVLDIVTKSLHAHAEFMLPDGAWDNSWGTRNFKWTWWGSRTSDGCQPGYALMADQDPVFYKVALQNTKLLAQCTHNKLLHGGPHYAQHGILPCVSHSIAHSKALATMLLRSTAAQPTTPVQLPRERANGVKAFPEIYTWLIAHNQWRGTITGYDVEYVMKGGHASGGALSLLWHEKAGTIIVASMNQYQLTTEAFNMQRSKDLRTIPLTPGFLLEENKLVYRNINDLKAVIEQTQEGNALVFNTRSSLVTDSQALPAKAGCYIQYRFEDDTVHIDAAAEHEHAVFSLPLVSPNTEKVVLLTDNKLAIHRTNCTVVVEANAPFKITGALTDRVFNFVPGMEAIPVQFDTMGLHIKISVQ